MGVPTRKQELIKMIKATKKNVELFLAENGDNLNASDEVKIHRAMRAVEKIKAERSQLKTAIKNLDGEDCRRAYLAQRIAADMKELENLNNASERLVELDVEVDMAEATASDIFGEIKGSV